MIHYCLRGLYYKTTWPLSLQELHSLLQVDPDLLQPGVYFR